MEYVLVGVLLLLIIGGFIMFLVLNATKKSGSVADADDEGAPGIGGDDTPLGDTTEHAGEQTEHGTTVGGQDADGSGGTGRPTHSGSAGNSAVGEDRTDPDAAAHLARPGEGEGHARLDFEGQTPATPPGAIPGARPAPPESAGAGAPDPQTSEAAEAARPASERLADRGV